MKILIVEDEIKTGEYLSKGLTEAGFVVDHADNGLTGYHLAMTAEYDLVILDIMLPDVNGWDIRFDIPDIMLTTLDQGTDAKEVSQNKEEKDDTAE